MKIFSQFNLKDYNSYRLEAICRNAYFPDNEYDILDFFRGRTNSYIILGGGFNIILSKKYYDADFIIFSGNYDRIVYNGGNSLYVEAGCDMKKLSEFALEKELSGLEIFYDIPATLGGAIVMNAGAGGESIYDVVDGVRFYDPRRNIVDTINKENIEIEYRNSFFQKNPYLIVCGVNLSLKNNQYSLIEAKMQSIKESRWAKQPREYPNAGSVFKRPTNHYVGPMIEKLGLKGFSIGGAMVSEKHAGFIVNTGNASGEDIIELISYVKKAVLEKFHIELEIEQRII